MKLLGTTLIAGLLVLAPDASARPGDRGARRPGNAHRQVHRPVARPVTRPVVRPTRPRDRDHRRRPDVRWPRPRGWWGSYYRRPHYVYGPSGYYYAPYYYGHPVATAGSVVTAPARRRIGLGFSLSHLDGSPRGADGAGLGAALRWRGDRVELELEVAGHDYPDDSRHDRRIGGNVYVDLARHTVTPYLVGGVGINDVSRPVLADTRQAFVAGGAGVALPFGDAITLSGDVRWHARWSIEDEDPGVRAAGVVVDSGDDDDERLLEARLGLMIYF